MIRALAVVALLAAPSAARGEPAPGLRVAAEMHAGALVVGAGTAAGWLLSGLDDECEDRGRLLWAGAGAFLAALAMPAAMWGTGRLLGGEGQAGWSWVGLAAAAQLDVILSLLVHKLPSSPNEIPVAVWVVVGVVGVLAPLTGATLGLELSG